jgi:hypothetical protein
VTEEVVGFVVICDPEIALLLSLSVTFPVILVSRGVDSVGLLLQELKRKTERMNEKKRIP